MPCGRRLTSTETLHILDLITSNESYAFIQNKYGITKRRVTNLANRYTRAIEAPVIEWWATRISSLNPTQRHWGDWARGHLEQPPARFNILPLTILADARVRDIGV